MKQIYILCCFALLQTLHLQAQTTFDWETATNNGVSVQQTVNTITATFTPASTPSELVQANGNFGSFAFVVASNLNETSVTISFSQPINVETLFAFNGDITRPPSNWTFTPTGGDNDVVVESINNNISQTSTPNYQGVHVVLNWSNVTEITITPEGPELIAVDDIVSDFSLSTQDLSTSNQKVKLFPNPSKDFIQFSNLKQIESYMIYNVLGSKVLEGTISTDEQIDIRDLSKGMYLLNLENGETLKFIKE